MWCCNKSKLRLRSSCVWFKDEYGNAGLFTMYLCWTTVRFSSWSCGSSPTSTPLWSYTWLHSAMVGGEVNWAIRRSSMLLCECGAFGDVLLLMFVWPTFLSSWSNEHSFLCGRRGGPQLRSKSKHVCTHEHCWRQKAANTQQTLTDNFTLLRVNVRGAVQPRVTSALSEVNLSQSKDTVWKYYFGQSESHSYE